jgi:hypothetical protein
MLKAEYVTMMLIGDKPTTHRNATTPIVLVLHIQPGVSVLRSGEREGCASNLLVTAFPQQTGYTVCVTLTGGISKVILIFDVASRNRGFIELTHPL